ncbi:MlaD family protein [Thauera sp.]|jgi:phospholipid/cholesterol/gamma-HCH transport system substrate-binding protein|uniref:MlaD family protein n=1 Tax=Thauera sp. TaxID=1905334 RepID=UPI002A36BF1F|nr:MlaD family protein [Thauera sp.]MDX9886313.1 MlaD family protein [Thauera sp.]
MEDRAHAFAAGLFALALGAGIVFALWWFSQDRQPMREVVLVARGDINGLGEQSRVRYRGLSVGTVKSIRIDMANLRNILVRVQVLADLPLTRGTTATLGTLGVTGLAYVQLDDRGADPTPLVGEQGEPPRIALGPGLLDEITDRTLVALERFGTVAERLAALFDEDGAARFRNLVTHLEAAAAGMDRSFAEVPETLAAVRKVLSPENVSRLSGLLANLERTSVEAGPAVADLRRLMQRVDQMAVRFDQAATSTSDSLVDGTLPQLNALLGDLTATSRRLGRLIDEVESTPQMLLTGRGAREPGPGERGFAPRQ